MNTKVLVVKDFESSILGKWEDWLNYILQSLAGKKSMICKQF